MSSIARIIRDARSSGVEVEAHLDQMQLAFVKARETLDSESIDMITRAIIGTLPTGVHSRRGVQKLVRRELGQSISLVSVRTDLRCKMADCERYQGAVRSFMSKLRAEVIEEFSSTIDQKIIHGRSEAHGEFAINP